MEQCEAEGAISMLEVYYISQIVLTGIALVTLWLACVQLRGIKKAREDDLRISRATFMLELDRRWEQEHIFEARRILRAMLDESMERVSVEHSKDDDQAQEKHQRLLLAGKLRTMREESKNDPEGEYSKLLALCGLFETTALLIKKNYVLEDDIIELFRGPIIGLDLCMRTHIAERQSEKNSPPGLMEHMLWLSDRTKLKTSAATN